MIKIELNQELLDKHIEEIGINKSKFIEQLLEEKFKNNKY